MKTFVCIICHQTFKAVKNVQPVKVVSGRMCQHCWSSANWGKAWADKCQTEETKPILPRLQ